MPWAFIAIAAIGAAGIAIQEARLRAKNTKLVRAAWALSDAQAALDQANSDLEIETQDDADQVARLQAVITATQKQLAAAEAMAREGILHAPIDHVRDDADRVLSGEIDAPDPGDPPGGPRPVEAAARAAEGPHGAGPLPR